MGVAAARRVRKLGRGTSIKPAISDGLAALGAATSALASTRSAETPRSAKAPSERQAASGHEMAAISGRIARHRAGGRIMRKLTSAGPFAGPRIASKAKARLERAKLVIIAARERAAEMAQQSPLRTSTIRPTVLQKRRLAERQAALRP